jgi:hypothetical protein
LRPIAWCSFVSGKPEIARKYLHLILESEPTANDFINAGHVEYCLSAKPKAMEYYLKALKQKGMSLIRFSKIMQVDAPILERNGVSPEELPLLVDYIRYLL